jgi:hypothetical protein
VSDGKPARQAGPLLVVAQAHPAAGYLRSLIAGDGTVACTESTGLLPLCDRAVTAWKLVEGRSGPSSALAAKSIRSMISVMRAVVLSRLGGQEWCEISTASVQAAEAFLCLYPAAKIACLYCHVSALTGEPAERDRQAANDDAFRGPKIWLGADVLSRTSYWTISAAAMLDFQHKHPDKCQSFRYEDFIDQPRAALLDLRAFFGLPSPAAGRAEPAGLVTDTWSGGTRPAGPPSTTIDRKELPQYLLDEVERILTALDYAR